MAYIFAAPVTTAGCGAGCDVKPGDPLLLTDPVGLVSAGTNLIDSLSGFRGYTDGNADGIVQQSEMTVVKGSLLGKSLVAQAVFDGKFLLPFAPDPPEFFLIPGDNQITVIWRPTTSEVTGDPYFGLASQPQVIDPVTNGLVSNVLYDPNYRQFDVEGYRVYRGRIDAPNELTLLAQFDYGGTVITDYTGSINPTPACAPEFSVLIGCPTDPSGTITFPVGGNKKNGTTLTFNTSYDLVGNLIQLNAGSGRSALAVGFVDSIIKQIDTISVGPPVVTDTLWTQFFTSTSSAISKADTAVSGGGKNGGCGPKSVCPVLSNSGIPFSFVDATPRNNLRYFYSVTAFDVNSIESGPSSLESPRNTKSITPVAGASNYISQGSLSFGVVGRGVRTDSLIPNLPTIDPTVGTFSGPMPPANGAQLAFVGQFVSKVFAQPGQVSAKLIDLTLGDARNGVPATYTFDVTSANGLHFTIVLPIQEQLDGTVATASSPPAAFAVADSALLATYGIPAGTALSGLVTTKLA